LPYYAVSNCNVICVIVEQESKVNARQSPAVTLVVQPVSVESSYLIAELNVGFAEAQIESAAVGGNAANVSL
jgi:hypothetical protein